MSPRVRVAAGLLAGAVALVWPAGAPRADPSGLRSRPLAPAGGSAMGFTAVPEKELGFRFVNRLDPENRINYIDNGSGVALADYDGDGRVDLFFAGLDAPDRLLRQTAPWRFRDVTEEAGLGDGGWSTGATFADVDDDGDLDLYVCRLGSRNRLYRNEGDGRFREAAAESGLDYPGASRMAAFADYDRDGDLDLYLLNNRVRDIESELGGEIVVRMEDGRPTVHPDYRDQYWVLEGRLQQAAERDRFYRNDGAGRFVDVTDEVGIAGHEPGLSVTWWDFDGDGWLDLYVANDFKAPDHLYRNRGDGTFVDVLPDSVGHTSWFSMGADFADVDGDGLFDLLVGDMSSTTHYKQKTTMGEMGRSAWFLTTGRPRQYMRNALFLNTGTPRFMEVAYLAGLDSTDWTWAIRFADFDNDGRQDVFVANGVERNVNDSDVLAELQGLEVAGRLEEAKRRERTMDRLAEANLAYRNRGELRFESVGPAWGLDHVGVSNGAAVADLDRDGDLDLVLNNLMEPSLVYRNEGGAGRRVLVELRGTRSNRFGIGARVRVRAGGREQVRQLLPERGYLSSGEPVVHFGLGEAERIEELEVEWPAGGVQRFRHLAPDRLYTVTEPEAALPAAAARPPVEPVFEPWAEPAGLVFRHAERPYDDYAREPLLPYQLSQLGPGMAWGDVDGDGDDDVYVGGAAGQAGALFAREDAGRFERTEGPWDRHRASEDMAPLFLDVDGDADLDLYVASGSHEFGAAERVLRDRLYRNEGSGRFVDASAEVLPPGRAASSAVAAADYDRDGDLDLFVGARSVPGRYPETPTSRLLRNEGGRFVVAEAETAPGLSGVGLVSAALWSDVDADGWPDLLLALDWGPVALFRNREGRLADATAAAGLDPYRGWWNGLAAGDVDGDGDLDYVATNLGRNTKYHASAEHPLRLYYSDFDRDRRLDLVESEYEGETEYPVRGRSCSSEAMPFVADEFPTYDAFARASLSDIYAEAGLDEAPHRTATWLDSSLLVNDGAGRFEVRALPRLAQASPGFGVALADVDGDGRLDLSLAQNFFGPQPETGRMDGGLGMLLRGDGRGGFVPVRADGSGIVIPDDATALTVADVDGDVRPDLAVAVNDAPLRVLRNRGPGKGDFLRVRLRGPDGNPAGVGARVRLVHASGAVQLREVAAGGGYLSQSSPALWFGLGDRRDPPRELRVRWPDGRFTRVTRGLDRPSLEVAP